MHEVTLQINLSPGDIAYALLTVPALVEAHCANVDETLAIVDCCRSQITRYVRSDRKLSEPEFNQRVERICLLAEDLKAKGYLDRIVYLQPGSSLQQTLSRKYFSNWVRETHDYSGCALMSYLAAFEVITTRFVLHYDGDMLLYQAPDYDWSVEARYLMDKEPRAVAATPRLSPPLSNHSNTPDTPCVNSVRPLKQVKGGWRDDWFSTRCYLIDREKLYGYLPLLQGWFLINTLAAKYMNRGYPRTLEMMLFKQVGGVGGWRLILKSKQAWLLHPATKPPRYIELLPQIQQCLQQGQVPVEQKGLVDIHLAAWEDYLTIEEA